MDTVLPGLMHAPNLHPAFVHAPLVLWPLALALWLYAAASDREDIFGLGSLLVYLAAAGSLAAVVSGFVATAGMGHEAPGHELVHVHRDVMLVASSLGLLTAVATFLARRRRGRVVRWLLISGLVATLLVTILGADRGASLVYRYGIGTAGEEPPDDDDHAHSHGSRETSGPHGWLMDVDHPASSPHGTRMLTASTLSVPRQAQGRLFAAKSQLTRWSSQAVM